MKFSWPYIIQGDFIMSDFLFVKGDKKKHCLFVNDKDVITLETNNSDEIVKIGNKILNGNDIPNSETKKVICNFLKSQNLDQIPQKIQILDSINEIDDIHKKISSIVFLDQKSPNEILKLFDKKYTNTGFIINFQGDIVFIPKLNDKNLCQHCVVRRYINVNRQLYKYKQFWSLKTRSISEKMLSFLKLLAKENIDSNNIFIISKKDYSVKKSKCLAYEGCKRCFGSKRVKKTEEVKLNRSVVNFKENGSRHCSLKMTDEVMSHLVTPLGPVVSLEDDQNVDRLNMPVYQSEISTNPLIKTFNYHGGKGRTSSQAKFSAIGEAMERYNAQQFGNEKVITHSFNWMKQHYVNVVDPKEFLIDPEYPILYSDNLILDWSLVKNLNDNLNYYVPSNCVFFVYHPTKNAFNFIPQETTGLASGMEISEAILQGMLEVIERDAYTIYYRNQIKPVTITASSIYDKRIQEMIYNLEINNIKVHLKYLKNDTGVYVIHCVTEDKSGKRPVYTHGAGASLNPMIAISRAITECVQLRVSQIKVLKNRALFENDPEYIPYISWGEGNKKDVAVFLDEKADCKISMARLPDLSSKNIDKDIQFITENLSKRGYKVLVANLSRSDNPLSTVRVLIPGFQPADDTLRRISKRMTGLPKFLNYPIPSKLFERNLFS